MFDKIVKKLIAPAVLSASLVFSGTIGTFVMAEETNQADAQDAEVISCEAFTLTIPKEIADISDVVTTDNGISFYEKLSKERYGGFVCRVSTYQNEKDYAFIPNFRRGGEIELADGSRLDVVIEYPSDVQFDIENEESIKNQRLISQAFVDQILPTLASENGTYIPQNEVDHTEIYNETLKKLCSDLKEKKDAQGLEEDGFSYMYCLNYDSDDCFGYAFADLTGTGYPALVIMDEDGSGIVYDMFVQVDGEVRHVFSSAERDRLTLCGQEGYDPAVIREDASGGADISETSFYILDPVEKELLPQVTFIYDGTADQESPWRIRYSIDEEDEPVTEEEWNERIENYGMTYIPKLTPLAAAEAE
ncbi:MAG: hypothetical protein IJ899_19215 [Blautia sp.]|nr:hypothetical protein [Blautia sp.]